ncbi:hypothetical protein DVV91_08965 [Clostridium botulinum]|uniref:AAA family ATPase n=1 Tax=Clostridium botulinum TaxID=1491 RepID=UPI0013F72B1F|nr:AAA family ATPase [Clostridium botulinum]MBN1074470.1 hypothetical protein [Clostridium botulinum]NFE61255.1 hypothetical protein [Clostridium botulinum]NFG11472.1 hypothetical protein [Clostridium botulinum]NFI51768.1 hypothetical protein [Clostridium botulinum]NFL57875.1 hypothetical protein [Clostridium botulinum]
MKLLQISLNNFRQFYGCQKIDFACDEQNITIIFGENGKGKTGIFRALMFGLFGDISLRQDDEKGKDLHIVNFKALSENINNPVDGSVKVIFEHKERKYEITRVIQGSKTKNSHIERVLDPKLHTFDKNGNYSAEPITNNEEIKVIINSILHEKIKDFFLFDAEKIDTLTKIDLKVKDEVKTAIVKLMQIDKLEEGISLLKRLYSNERKRMLESSHNLDLKRREKEIENLIEELKKIEKNIELKEENKESCSNEINEIETKLLENEGVRKIKEKFEEEKQKKNMNAKLASGKKDELKQILLQNGHIMMMKDSYIPTKGYLEQIIVDQKDLIPLEVIEKSLNDMVCACCKTDLNENEEKFKNILKIKNTFKRSELTPLISLINSTIHDISVDEEELYCKVEKYLLEFRELKDNIEEIEKMIDKYNLEITLEANQQENLKELEKTLESKKEYLEELKVEIAVAKERLEEKNKDKEKKEEEFNKVLKTQDSLKKDKLVLDHIENLKTSLEGIFKEYSDEMRKKLTSEATKIFKQLIDKKDKDLINKIHINDKYEIDLIGWENINITQDISQGQRQVVALSFITALAKVAAGNTKNIDFPLFMDTPFGRISGNNRDNLIDNIHNLTSQWILLLTDTELSRTEEMRFKSTRKLGKWYKLDQVEEYHSNIVEIDLNEVMATRG